MMRTGWLTLMLTCACASAARGQSVCARKLLTPNDVAGILSDPIVGMKDIPGDAQSCNFVTTSFPAITVMLRPGLGRATVSQWASGQIMPTTPVAGVGDRAVWVSASNEIVADKSNVLCDIGVRGAERDLAQGAAEGLQKRLGDLCNKIYKALAAQPK